MIWIVNEIGLGKLNEDLVDIEGKKMILGGDDKERWRGEEKIKGKKLNRCDRGIVDIKSGYMSRYDMVKRLESDNCF